MKYDLSILIPARNEEWLSRTVKGLLEAKQGNTEILVGLDGQWANPGIEDHPDVTIVYFPQSIGQRAVTNQLCRLSSAKWVMKLDAHCILDEGFDVKLLEGAQDDWTILPAMRHVHAFDWVCKSCGARDYQGPTEKFKVCPKCGKDREREVIWKAKESPRSRSFRFDKDLHFQYFGEYMRRPEVIAQGDLTDSMSAQGSCFMLTRKKYWELDICDEAHGSWGQQGTEVACKTWLSGGRLVVNNKTWYAHMFRTQGGDFGFPYPLSGSDVEKARKYSKDLWINIGWDKSIEGRDLNWLIDKFSPVPGWHQTETVKPKLKKGVVYYTDNHLDPVIMQKVQTQILKGIKEKHVVSVSLKPISFGKNIVINAERGYLTMAKQILAGLEASTADIIYFCEHDVLYDPSHFEFVPPSKDKVYYNINVWRMRLSDGHALYTSNLQQLSGLVAYRDILITHYKKRVDILQEYVDIHQYAEPKEWKEELIKEYNRNVRAMGFEPGTHNRPMRVDDLKAESFESRYPNVDIRHSTNLTPSRWNKEQFRNQKFTQGWKECNFKDLPNYDNLEKIY